MPIRQTLCPAVAFVVDSTSMIICNSPMTLEVIRNNTKRKKGKTVTTVAKHIERYLTTQFQTQAMNIYVYTDLQNALLSHAL